MIQRVQTIWLLLASVMLFGLFIFPYVNYIDLVGLGKKLYVTGSYTAVNGEPVKQSSFILQTIAAALVAAFPLFIIFKYKDRKLQIRLIFLEIVLIFLMAIWLYVSSSQTLSMTSQYLGANNIGIGFFLLPIAIIFLSMALGAIRKDEKLIKSAERLR